MQIPRVLQVFTLMNRGGAESMIMNYYRQIDRNKIQFDFLVHRKERGVFEDEIESLGGKIYRMPEINPVYPQKYYKQLNTFFQSHHYNVIHSHINTFSSFPLKIAEKNNIACRIAHAHTTTLPLTFNLIAKKPNEAAKIFFKSYQKNKVQKYASHFIACGRQAGDWLFNKAEYSILPNAISASRYIYDETKASVIRKKYNLNNKLVIGHVGNFSYPKNYPFILNVFKKIKENRANSKLMLIGNGKMRSEVERLTISLNLFNDVIFLGIRNDVPDLLQMIDIFLFPSFYEGLPVTLIEAQASGLKIFASDAITREVALTDNVTFISLEKSPEYWAEQILKALPYERKDNSRIIKAKGYDIVESAKLLETFYLDQTNQSTK